MKFLQNMLKHFNHEMILKLSKHFRIYQDKITATFLLNKALILTAVRKVYWVSQKSSQIYTVIAYICIGKVAWFEVYICGNIWNTYYLIFMTPKSRKNVFDEICCTNIFKVKLIWSIYTIQGRRDISVQKSFSLTHSKIKLLSWFFCIS